MDDLISREAAIQAIADIALRMCVADDETDDNETCKEKSAMFKAHQDSLMAIRHLPSVSAVPLDILSKELASNCKPCTLPFISCPDENHDCKICNGRKAWEKVIKKWMEEQDASN